MGGANSETRLSRWVTFYPWAGLLLLIVVLRIVLRDHERYFKIVDSEQGIVENLTVVFSLAAAILCVAVFRRRRGFPRRWLATWFLVCAIGCVGYAGEESSWGQHWFGWSSPEFFEEQNRQRETNLHNLGKYSTQRLPKALLTAGILGGGLVLPLYFRRKKRRLSPAEAIYWWLPGAATLPVVYLVLATRILERLRTWLHVKHTFLWDIHFKENNEMMMSAFFVVYALSVLSRLKAVTGDRSARA